MNTTGQGVLQRKKLTHWLTHTVLAFTLSYTSLTFSGVAAKEDQLQTTSSQKHHVLIVYSPDSTLHTNIIDSLTEELKPHHSEFDITKTTPNKIAETKNYNYDLVVAMGPMGMKSAETDFPYTKKLFISTDPNKYQLHPDKNKNDSILYMAQPYCRQMQFIKLINPQWKTISILNSAIKPVNSAAIIQCANVYDLNLYSVNTSKNDLTKKLKHALNNSDVLLALPDNSIYNKKTVKNILLTSYRYRKPVIAFSNNFVNAGALASINSDTKQIAQSTGKMIKQFFNSGFHFKDSVNYPDSFNINLNKQVFMALDISLPDIKKIKKRLLHNTGISGKSK